ncbi:MAG TPA: SEC-C domain-containing protein, partial [Spirochaetia bacterium]|nr:SEC-C domain-containing protein [Spirochaetia bacterium]
MGYCQRMVARGKRELARHNPDTALRFFESALNECPIENRGDLSLILFYLGITLAKLGRKNGAVRSFSSSAKLMKRSSYSRAMLRRYANDYGMAKQLSEEQDDWNAFFSIQLRRYLTSKRTQRILSPAERDMIHDLIAEHWRHLRVSGLLVGKRSCEKLDVFRKVHIVFPLYVVPDALPGRVIPVNFTTQSRVTDDGRCPCGSGIPYMKCCGRTSGAE